MIEVLIVLALILLNGVFALSELAVVSSRRRRLESMAAEHRPGAAAAVALAADPGKFLSSVQIGITLIGVVNGAYSGETFGEAAADALRGLGLSSAWADPLGFAIVIAVITYLSVIVGELAPKNLALRDPEAIACAVAPAMTLFARVASPVVWVLDASTRALFRLFGRGEASEARVTEEEIKTVIAEAESAGVLEKGEREMIAGVMRFADRAVVGLMTPRTEVEWIDLEAAPEVLRARLAASRHSRLPAGEGSVDRLVGVIEMRDALAQALSGAPLDPRAILKAAPIVPETMDALDVLAALRAAEAPMALVHDEYGHFEGLVTPADVLEAITGVVNADVAAGDPYAVRRDDGSWLLAGSMPADEMAETLAIRLPDNRAYETVAGFVLAALQRIPATGERVDVSGWRFEVVDIDGRRIDKVLAARLPPSRRVV